MALPLVIAASGLVNRWRDIGPILWAGAAGTVVLWLALLAVLAMQSEPRRVRAGAATLEPGGTETPAVVNLMTNDWELGRESVPATLLDLAARRYLSVEWLGEQTFVRVRERRTAPDDLTDYEQLVLDHLGGLSKETADGLVPADALTTGPDGVAANWWQRFERGVISDARHRGLSRPRWGPGARTLLTAMAIVVGISVGIAATTLTSDKKDDNPLATGAGLGFMSAAALVATNGKLRGERDTLDGRGAAARWLGLRTMLSNDPTFATQPPAAVSIWDRIMSYGAAMGVAHTAVRTLPFGAESERQAWSPVGNRWRTVRIRYPRRVPPGYGRHPAIVALVGLVATAVGVLIAPGAVSVAGTALRAIDDLANDHTVPTGVRVAVAVALAAVVGFGAIVAVAGVAMLVAGVGDLLRGRRSVEGRVLRLRQRGDDKHRHWYLAVDDGSADRVRAWRVSAPPPTHQGAVVRARVSPWLQHVSNLTPIESRPPATGVVAPAVPPQPAAAALGAMMPALPLPLLDAVDVAAALGVPVRVEPSALAHPLAVDGASRTFETENGGRVLTAWIQPSEIESFRNQSNGYGGAETTPIAGVGDEAYRATIGGGLVVRVRDQVLMVVATLPAMAPDQGGHAIENVARTMAARLG